MEAANEPMDRPLPAYQCHKKVRAHKILEIWDGDKLDLGEHGRVFVGHQWIQLKSVEKGGYYVQYEDGYTSYSPAKAFEEGYTLIQPEAPEPPAPPRHNKTMLLRLGNDAVLLGLDAENAERLVEHEVITLDLNRVGLPGKLVVLYDETFEKVRYRLQKMLPETRLWTPP